jgi:hypothetical protein
MTATICWAGRITYCRGSTWTHTLEWETKIRRTPLRTYAAGPARLLFILSPAGFEEFVYATSEPAKERTLPPRARRSAQRGRDGAATGPRSPVRGRTARLGRDAPRSSSRGSDARAVSRAPSSVLRGRAEGLLEALDPSSCLIHRSAWRDCMKSPHRRINHLSMRRLMAAYTNASPLAHNLS